MTEELILAVVGTPIGNLADLSPRGLNTLADASVMACEDTRRTGLLLSTLGIPAPRLVVVNEHTETAAIPRLLRDVRDGEHVALVSDAGMPAVSDPGARLVAAAVAEGIRVEVVPGPSAVLTALVASGLLADRFCFEGFLPRKGSGRTARVAALIREPRVAVLFEAPHRIARTVDDLRAACGDDRRVAICREMTKRYEEVWRGSLADAADRFETVEPRGEHVLVLDGAAPIGEPDDADLIAAIAVAVEAGDSRRDAISKVTEQFGVAHRRVYELAHAARPT